MTVVTVEEAKSRMEELAQLAAGGESVRIAIESGLLLELRPVAPSLPAGQKRVGGQGAMLVKERVESVEHPPVLQRQRVFGQWQGLVEVGPEFFEPLSEEELALFTDGSVFPETDSEVSASEPRHEAP